MIKWWHRSLHGWALLFPMCPLFKESQCDTADGGKPVTRQMAEDWLVVKNWGWGFITYMTRNQHISSDRRQKTDRARIELSPRTALFCSTLLPERRLEGWRLNAVETKNNMREECSCKAAPTSWQGSLQAGTPRQMQMGFLCRCIFAETCHYPLDKTFLQDSNRRGRECSSGVERLRNSLGLVPGAKTNK